MIPAGQFPYLKGMSQELIVGRNDGTHQLALGLELILDGFERMRQASDAASAVPRG